MTFNDLQRLMRKKEIPDNIAYVLAEMYERFGQVLRQQDDLAKALTVIAQNMQGFVVMREQDRKDIMNLMRKTDMVRSEAIDPDESEH